MEYQYINLECLIYNIVPGAWKLLLVKVGSFFFLKFVIEKLVMMGYFIVESMLEACLGTHSVNGKQQQWFPVWSACIF